MIHSRTQIIRVIYNLLFPLIFDEKYWLKKSFCVRVYMLQLVDITSTNIGNNNILAIIVIFYNCDIISQPCHTKLLILFMRTNELCKIIIFL